MKVIYTRTRQRAFRVPCPWCRAPVGAECQVLGGGKPLTLSHAHPARLEAAGVPVRSPLMEPL